MLARQQLSPGLGVLLATAAIMFSAGQVKAEPSIHYADAPAVLPAPVNYQTAQYTSGATVTQAGRSTHVTYQRAYTKPTCTPQRVVRTAPVVRYEEPVIYTRTFHAPRRVLHINTGPNYYPYRAGHYGYGQRYDRLYRHHYPHRTYVRGHHGHHYRHHYRPRGWGFSAGYGRGHHGHHGGGFSFYLNR